jgi:hypothetical protein
MSQDTYSVKSHLIWTDDDNARVNLLIQFWSNKQCVSNLLTNFVQNSIAHRMA